jgi:PEP-CTERM motif
MPKGSKEMKRTAAIVGVVLGLTAGLAAANPLPLQGRDINGNAVGATDASAVFEYDPNLNLTWLRDWNYAATTSYANASLSGEMNWNTARVWASSLTVGSFSGWSLPSITDTGTPPGCNYGYVGTDCGFNVYGYGTNSPQAATLSPMAYLWYAELGNKAYSDTSGNGPQSNWGLKNTGPFTNMQLDSYWSGTEYSPFPATAWIFNTGDGHQGFDIKSYAFSAVAVRSGDVAASVPEPATLALLSLSLGALGLASRRRPV